MNDILPDELTMPTRRRQVAQFGRILCVLSMGVLTILGGGCGQRTDYAAKFGVNANALRRQNGIAILPKEWSLDGSKYGTHLFKYGTHLVWYNPERTSLLASRRPAHAAKELNLVNGEIKEETDVYSSGKFPELNEPKQEEALYLTYSFERAKQGLDPWSCTIFSGPLKGQYSKQQADAILSQWKVPGDPDR